jgi:hypothetical protein
MTDRRDILGEVSAREYGVTHLVFFIVAWTAALGIALAVRGWWAVLWMAAATLTVAIIAAQVVPMIVRGGKYRVLVEGQWLRAESPNPALGPSFAVPLSAISKLIVRAGADGPDSYEVHTDQGESFLLGRGIGEGVFQALHRLHPEIPIERR